MSPQTPEKQTERYPCWDFFASGDYAQSQSTNDSPRSQSSSGIDPYESQLAQIDAMITKRYSTSVADKIRDGKQYKAMRKVSLAHSNGEEIDIKWLKDQEAFFWYTHSHENFPLSPTRSGSAWDVIINYSSTSNTTRSAWDISHLADKIAIFTRSADLKSSSAAGSTHNSNVQERSAPPKSSVPASKSTLPNTTVNNTVSNTGRAQSLVLNSGSFGQLGGANGGGRKVVSSISAGVPSHQAQTQTHGQVGKGTSIARPLLHTKGWLEFRNSARISPPTSKASSKSAQVTTAPTSKPSTSYKSAQTSAPVKKTVYKPATTIKTVKDANKAAALKAWAAFPDQAAKEDRESAAAYNASKALGLASGTLAVAPAIKETYNKVAISETLKRKVVEKSVATIQ